MTTVEDRQPTSGSTLADPVVYDDAAARHLLITVIFGVIAFSSSMTIVSAVLATIADDLHSTASTLSWAVTGLILVSAVGTPLMGRVGDAVGRRRIFLFGTATVLVSMIGCMLAWNAPSFIGFRMLTGFGMACTMPNGMAMVIDAHSPERRAAAIGWFQMVMAGAPVLALVVGAWLTDLFGWRSVFVLLIPFAFLGLVLGVLRTEDTGPAKAGVTVDWSGAAALGFSTLALLLGLERVKHSSFGDPMALWLFGISAVILALFVSIERRVRQPLLRLEYFRRRDFTGPLIAQPMTQFAYMGGMVITPLLLKNVFGMGVGASSWILLFRPATYSVFSPIGGRLASKLGNRTMIGFGSVMITVSMAVFALAAHLDALWMVVAALALSGFAVGLATPSYSTSVAASVDPADLGVANGMAATLSNIGTLAGIQTMFVILGDGRGTDDFAKVFWIGAAVGACGLLGALVMRGGSRLVRHVPVPLDATG